MTLTLKKATELALAMETAEANAETLQGTSGRNGVQELKQPVLRMQTEKHSGYKYSGTCFRCGQKLHKATKCPFKEYKCLIYGKVGHLKKVCRKATELGQSKGRVNSM